MLPGKMQVKLNAARHALALLQPHSQRSERSNAHYLQFTCHASTSLLLLQVKDKITANLEACGQSSVMSIGTYRT